MLNKVVTEASNLEIVLHASVHRDKGLADRTLGHSRVVDARV